MFFIKQIVFMRSIRLKKCVGYLFCLLVCFAVSGCKSKNPPFPDPLYNSSEESPIEKREVDIDFYLQSTPLMQVHPESGTLFSKITYEFGKQAATAAFPKNSSLNYSYYRFDIKGLGEKKGGYNITESEFFNGIAGKNDEFYSLEWIRDNPTYSAKYKNIYGVSVDDSIYSENYIDVLIENINLNSLSFIITDLRDLNDPNPKISDALSGIVSSNEDYSMILYSFNSAYIAEPALTDESENIIRQQKYKENNFYILLIGNIEAVSRYSSKFENLLNENGIIFSRYIYEKSTSLKSASFTGKKEDVILNNSIRDVEYNDFLSWEGKTESDFSFEEFNSLLYYELLSSGKAAEILLKIPLEDSVSKIDYEIKIEAVVNVKNSESETFEYQELSNAAESDCLRINSDSGTRVAPEPILENGGVYADARIAINVKQLKREVGGKFKITLYIYKVLDDSVPQWVYNEGHSANLNDIVNVLSAKSLINGQKIIVAEIPLYLVFK